jgi:hypothetical protein
MESTTPMRYLLLTTLVCVTLAAAAGTQTFTGTISDAMCATAGHAAMRMGPTDAECAKACAQEHDADYVLVAGKTVYSLSDQKTPERFAGKKVKVVGTLDAKAKKIQVVSITPS